MTASPQGSYGNDIFGNGAASPGATLAWDCLNRMASFTANGGTTAYTYRADGLRVSKVLGSTSTSFAYDGHMGFEDVDSVGGTPTVTAYGVGPRGIDRIQKVSNSTVVVYPVYDGHGNMVADLSKGNSGSYNINDQRAFDAWGGVRSGAQTGDPKGRYCASLGHKGDDESGLTYMRARYYEASSGRFISEDPKQKGANWYSLASGNPVNRIDGTGLDSALDQLIQQMFKALEQDSLRDALSFLDDKVAQIVERLQAMEEATAEAKANMDAIFDSAHNQMAKEPDADEVSLTVEAMNDSIAAFAERAGVEQVARAEFGRQLGYLMELISDDFGV